MAEKKEFARLEKGDVDYFRITDPKMPEYLRFELIEDQVDKLFYTIKVLNDKYKATKIRIPFKVDENTIYNQKNSSDLEGSFSNCIFEENVDIKSFIFSLHFKDSSFEGTIKVEGKPDDSTFDNRLKKKSITFQNCKISASLVIQNHINYDLSLLENTSVESLNLSQGKFHQNVRIKESRIKECNFYNTSFYGLIDFYNTQFEQPTQFHQTDFMKVAIFAKAIFHKEVQFLYSKVDKDSYFSFENTEFKKFIDISRANFYCTFNFWSAKGLTGLSDLELHKLCDSELYIYDSLSEFDDNRKNNVYSILRESVRTIKNNFISRNDKISSLEYQKEEMNIYALEVKEGNMNFWDRVILFFNKYSNNHGVSFSRGILFTLVVSCSFLFIHEFFYHLNCHAFFNCESARPIKEYFNLFVQYTIITDFTIPEYFKYENNPIENAWFYLGKIFIGIGYYQTVAAFRKFLKN